MYKLLNNETITPEIKEAFKRRITRAYLKVLATNEEEEILINEENYLQSIDFNDERYIEGEGIIGSCVAKELNAKFVNVDSNFNIENRQIECYIGAEDEESVTHYLNLGTFIVQKPTNDNVKDNTTFNAFDYMIKFNIKYEHRMEETYTISELLQDICDQAGVVCATTVFRNSDYVVSGNVFDSGVTCRDVLKAIAQIAFSWARINEQNELVLDFNQKSTIEETINYDEYYTLSVNNKFGPINTIVLRNSKVEGENVTIVDETSTEPTKEIIISDNPFAFSQETRQALIQAGEALYGFEYIPLQIDTIGIAYLNCEDKIIVENMQDVDLETYIFNTTISYGGTLKSSIKTPAMTEIETKYKFNGSVTETIRKTELMVDKANQRIEGIVSTTEVVEQNIEALGTDLENATQSVETLNNDLQAYKETTETRFTQDRESFEFQFNKIIQQIDNLTDATEEQLQTISKYIRFDNGNIILGETGNELTLHISNNSIDFMQSGNRVAYFSNNKLYVTDAEILSSLRIGSFAFIPRDNGSLSFKKVGE